MIWMQFEPHTPNPGCCSLGNLSLSITIVHTTCLFKSNCWHECALRSMHEYHQTCLVAPKSSVTCLGDHCVRSADEPHVLLDDTECATFYEPSQHTRRLSKNRPTSGRSKASPIRFVVVLGKMCATSVPRDAHRLPGPHRSYGCRGSVACSALHWSCKHIGQSRWFWKVSDFSAGANRGLLSHADVSANALDVNWRSLKVQRNSMCSLSFALALQADKLGAQLCAAEGQRALTASLIVLV